MQQQHLTGSQTQWTRHLTNQTVDIWLAGRDADKTLFRMDRSGCIRKTGVSLTTHHFTEAFDVVFVFEINALMHPQCRVLPTRHLLLYPTFDLDEAQIANFAELGVSVMPDDAILKPPNPAVRQLLEEATTSRRTKMLRPKDRLLIFPGDIRPMKGQSDFLQGLLTEKARFPASLQRLRGITVVIAGGCDGNETYCAEVVGLTQQVTSEGILNVVVADQLKDEELSQIFAAALGVVIFSRIDCNPRSAYEGFVTDTPFFVTEKVAWAMLTSPC
jgi:glycosyltransferase involved in cell wall biosynthesis